MGLEQALLVLPDVGRLFKTSVLSNKEAQEASSRYQVVIYDRVPPPIAPTSGGVLYLGVNGPAASVGEEATAPGIDRWDEHHPALRYVNLSVVRISKGNALRPAAGAKAIAEAKGRPLIVALERPGLRSLSFGWNLLDSDLPLRVGFPILLSNSLTWLSQAGGGATPLRLRPGAVVTLPVPPDARRAEVVPPDNTHRTLPVINGVASFTEADHVGVYHMTAGPRTWRWAVDLRSEDESDLTPNKELHLGARTVSATAGPPKIERQIWPYLASLALLVLLAEWRLYHRRY